MSSLTFCHSMKWLAPLVVHLPLMGHTCHTYFEAMFAVPDQHTQLGLLAYPGLLTYPSLCMVRLPWSLTQAIVDRAQ